MRLAVANSVTYVHPCIYIHSKLILTMHTSSCTDQSLQVVSLLFSWLFSYYSSYKLKTF